MIRGKLISYGFGVLFLTIFSLAFAPTVSAETDWINDNLTATEGEIPEFLFLPGRCEVKSVPIGAPDAATAEVCAYKANGWEYAIHTEFTYTGPNPWNGTTANILLVGLPGDKAMYKVEGVTPDGQVTFLDGSDHFIFDPGSTYDGPRQVSIIKNIRTKLERTATGFKLKQGAIEPLLADQNGSHVGVKMIGISYNSKWLSVLAEPAGLVHMNLETLEKRWVSKYTVDYSEPFINLAGAFVTLSNNGQYLMRSGPGIPPVMTEVTGGCGLEFNTFHTDWVANPGPIDINACAERNLTEEASEGIGGPLIFGQLIIMPEGNNELIGHGLRYVYEAGNPDPIAVEDKIFNIHKGDGSSNPGDPTDPNDPSPWLPDRLGYLALGDSYSSGEGDTALEPNGTKYYRDLTDNNGSKPYGIPREKCHVSPRSYPFKLALEMGYSEYHPDWHTVACSGAIKRDIMPEDRSSDRGQESRLLGFSNYEELKEQALNEFIPGRVKQVNFVQENRPRVITLTIGGNDIGFADKVRSCVTSVTTCDIVNSRRGHLASEILGQYEKLRDFYKDLSKASDYESKIYVLGYPQFINGDFFAACGLNTGALNPSEREMIVNGITYFNNVIEKAADAAGVKYIDIEDSLAGHRLCDSGSKSVTGIAINPPSEMQESFHPNAQGHASMASKATDQSNTDGLDLMVYDTCPSTNWDVCPDAEATKNTIETPAYFQNVNRDQNVIHQIMTNIDQVRNTAIDVVFGIASLQANSIVSLFGFSDPVDLGQYQVAADGSLHASIPIPASMPAGYHTLVLQGKTFSGESVEFEQTILIQGSDPNDRDEDGVPDATDPCLYVPAGNQDYDQDGQDDGCDPEIGEPPAIPQDPFRMRAGNPTKTYAGTAEAANALYLERNIHTSAQTGVTGDYDADHDGWVVIATNQPASGNPNVPTVPPLSPHARFWLQDITNNNVTTKLPHISFRTKENGCAQYKPADLSKITEANAGTRRVFVQEALDTNTCRIEAPAADADGNGQPDNTQPLYRARNGNPAISHVKPDGTTVAESSNKVYLERSTRAAEAQLGKSDYGPNDSTTPTTVNPTDTKDYRQAWSLLASTDNAWYMSVGVYKKLITPNGQLFVVTAVNATSTQCTAYKPQTLATTKHTTQTTRTLQLDFWQTLLLSGGCNG